MMEFHMRNLYTKIYQLTDHSVCKVDTPKRVGGYIIDWVVGGILSGLPAVLMYSGITQRSDMFSDLYVFEALGYSRLYAFGAGFLCVLFALFYYVYVPWKIYPGQTLGKHIAGYKIVKTDDSNITLKTLWIRQVVGLFILEGAAFIVSNYLRQMTSLTLNYYVDYYLAIAGMLITMISIILVLKTDSHRALHDYLAKTKLVLVEHIAETSKEDTVQAINKEKEQGPMTMHTTTTKTGKKRLSKKK